MPVLNLQLKSHKNLIFTNFPPNSSPQGIKNTPIPSHSTRYIVGWFPILVIIPPNNMARFS